MNAEPTSTTKGLTLRELAERYHAETEAYDRTVCTGPIVDGSIQPFGPRQHGLINRNARDTFARLMTEATAHGITDLELHRAIGKAA